MVCGIVQEYVVCGFQYGDVVCFVCMVIDDGVDQVLMIGFDQCGLVYGKVGFLLGVSGEFMLMGKLFVCVFNLWFEMYVCGVCFGCFGIFCCVFCRLGLYVSSCVCD